MCMSQMRVSSFGGGFSAVTILYESHNDCRLFTHKQKGGNVDVLQVLRREENPKVFSVQRNSAGYLFVARFPAAEGEGLSSTKSFL